MQFKLIPTLDTMIGLYHKPRNFARFEAYLETLQGDTKSDLAVPLAGFNPMAKEHVLEKLEALKRIRAEETMADTIQKLNTDFAEHARDRTFGIALNLSDDTA